MAVTPPWRTQVDASTPLKASRNAATCSAGAVRSAVFIKTHDWLSQILVQSGDGCINSLLGSGDIKDRMKGMSFRVGYVLT